MDAAVLLLLLLLMLLLLLLMLLLLLLLVLVESLVLGVVLHPLHTQPVLYDNKLTEQGEGVG